MKTLVIWIFFLTLISLYPVGGTSQAPYADKALHFVLYAITALLLFSVVIKKTRFKKALMTAFFLPSVYGIALEVVQGFTGRTMSLWDGVADVLGALAGVLFIGSARRWK